jgi:hypothetical protein
VTPNVAGITQGFLGRGGAFTCSIQARTETNSKLNIRTIRCADFRAGASIDQRVPREVETVRLKEELTHCGSGGWNRIPGDWAVDGRVGRRVTRPAELYTTRTIS